MNSIYKWADTVRVCVCVKARFLQGHNTEQLFYLKKKSLGNLRRSSTERVGCLLAGLPS